MMDVAEAAGVSLKTVSRVINGQPHVRPQVVEKVQETVRILGFVPNAAARSLAAAKSFMIGAFFENPSPYYIASLQAGAMAACRGAGYHLVIEEVALSDPAKFAQFQSTLRTLRLDGAILSPPVCDSAAILDCFEARGIPVVRISPFADPDRFPAVYSRDDDGAEQVARHLLNLGHRSIAYVGGPPNHMAAVLRRNGFLGELSRHGIAPSSVEEVQGDFSFQSGFDAGVALLGKEPHVTAIFAANDDMAAGVAAAAARLGIKIPEEVSLVGFDDSPVATLVWPPLTTIRQPIAEMSAAAARMLMAGSAAAEPPSTFDVELVDRKSTGLNRELVRS